MASPLKIGLIGTDTSHAPAFAKILNTPNDPDHVPGGRITVAFPGGSPDFALSWDRVQGFAQRIKEENGVELVDSVEAVAQAADAIIISAADGRVHRDYVARVAPYGKPVFVDKPFATTSADAIAMVELAAQHNITLATASSLRFMGPVQEALANSAPITGADAFGPMKVEESQGAFFWYGIHSVEMIYAALGRGCKSVQVFTNDDVDVAVGTWADGRIGTVRGSRYEGGNTFGLLLHTHSGPNYVAPYSGSRSGYSLMLEQLIAMFQGGPAAVDPQDSIEIVRFCEAANESRETGKAVAL